MKRSTTRILTTHVGSLIRPPALQDFLRLKQAGKPYDEPAYQHCLTDSVAEVVKQQAETGIDVPSDGEFGKSISWAQYALDAAVRLRAPADQERCRQPVQARRRPHALRRVLCRARRQGSAADRHAKRSASGPIAYTGQDELQRDIANFKAALKDVQVEEAFLPVAAPASVIPDRKNEYYKSEEELQVAIAEAMRTEYKTIIDAGFLVQLDDARSAVTYDRMVPPASFADYQRWLEKQIEIMNHALEGLPAERIRYHICWGSWPGPHTSDVPLKDIVDMVLKAKVGAFVIEGANPRHEHEWKVWQRRQAGARPGAHPRRHQPRHQCGGASRTGGRAHRAAGQAASGARTSSPAPIAASRRGRSIAASIPRSCGRSWRRWSRAPGLRARNSGRSLPRRAARRRRSRETCNERQRAARQSRLRWRSRSTTPASTA